MQKDINTGRKGTGNAYEMPRWRKILVFILATVMIGSGIFFLWGELLLLQHQSMRAGILIGTVMLILFGVYFLWADLVAPLLGIKTWEDR
jgi:hypothetical protein